jgi:hypothetical protein
MKVPFCPTAPIWLTGSETNAPVSCPITQSFGKRTCAVAAQRSGLASAIQAMRAAMWLASTPMGAPHHA